MRWSRARTISGIACGCVALTACGSTGAPSGTVTNGANSSPAGPNPALQLAKCMRAHGVPNFPDPSARGGIDLDGTGLNPQSPAFQSARHACKRFLPNRGQPRTLTVTAAQKRAALAFAECMRTHGEPDFPDPTSTVSTTPELALHGMLFPVGAGLDPNSPAFRQAMTACGVKPPA